MGKLSRDKGRRFEQKIVRWFRVLFPSRADEIRRSDQGHGAALSDVTGVPGFWVECQDAAKGSYDPVKKLNQAIDDVNDGTTPIAVTHEKGSKRVWVTMQACDLEGLLHRTPYPQTGFPVTISWEDFADLIKERT